MARITDEKILMDRVVKMLPTGIPASAIEKVYGGGGTYWAYLAPGYKYPETGYHTINGDTLADLKKKLRTVVVWEDDPDLDE